MTHSATARLGDECHVRGCGCNVFGKQKKSLIEHNLNVEFIAPLSKVKNKAMLV